MIDTGRRWLGSVGLGSLCWLSLVFAQPAWSGALWVEQAWIREAPPMAQAMAGYLVLGNDGDLERVLVGASSRRFSRVMLHRSVLQGNVVRMEHLKKIPLQPGERVAFVPGGYHLMLIGATTPLKNGDRVPVVLEFDGGERLSVMFAVRGPGTGAP